MSAGSVFAAITIEEVAALAARLSITIEEAAVEMATDTVTSEIDAETASIMDIFGGEIEITSEEVESMVADITDGYGESVAGSEYISLSTVKDLSADVKKTSNFFRLPSANTVLSTLYGFLLNKGFSSFEEYIENNDFSNPDNIPLITDLYKQVISVTTWPDKSKDNFTIVDGQLTDGCFRIGINV
jgi:hypothetical protein